MTAGHVIPILNRYYLLCDLVIRSENSKYN